MSADVTDLDAYLDDELDLEEKLAVEIHLAENPDAAARMMARFRERTALRLLLAAPRSNGNSLAPQAGKLRRRLSGQRMLTRLPSLGAIGGLGVALLLLLSVPFPRSSADAGAPAFVADAVMSYETGLLRAAMRSQPEVTLLDDQEIQRAMRIRVPRLPSTWVVTDVQIFPADDGPALQLMIRNPSGKHISIFAVRGPSGAPRSPVAIRRGRTSVAYWREGDVSYALTGIESPEALDLAAEYLASEGATF